MLMISLDRGLLGVKLSGDVVRRHENYGRGVARLDIVVFAHDDTDHVISHNVRAFSTRAHSLLGKVGKAFTTGSRLFKAEGYDLIVTQDPMFTGLAGWLLKTRHRAKLIVHLHGDFIGSGTWYTRNIRAWSRVKLAGFLIRRADAVRVMSEGQKEALVEAGTDARLIRVIATPVDLERFAKPTTDAAVRESVDGWNWQHTVLMVARKDPVKDFHTLFSAMSHVFKHRDDVGLWLVGNFEDHVDIPLPKERVRLTPRLGPEQMPECYGRADMVVLSSQSESFGKVLVEANAAGKPIVATATTGAREIVRHGFNGWLVPVGCSRELGERILQLLSSPDTAQRMGRNGQNLMYEKYADNTSKVIGFWRDVVGDSQSTPVAGRGRRVPR